MENLHSEGDEPTLHEITQYILSTPAYQLYSEQNRYTMLRSIGPSVVAKEIEIETEEE